MEPSGVIENEVLRSEKEAAQCERFREFAVAVWQDGRLAAIDEYLSGDCLAHIPTGDLQGPDNYHQHVEASRAAFTEFDLEFEDVVAEGDRVVARWVLNTTHTSEFQGTEATGNRVRLPGITIVRFEEGWIVEAWDCWDLLTLLGQIDALPGFER